MDKDIDDTEDLHYSIIERTRKLAIEKAITDFDGKLESYLRENLLLYFGIEFKLHSDFFDFCSKRLTRVLDTTTNSYNVYLDFIDNDNRGSLIGCYSNKYKYSINMNSINITIG